MGDQGWVAEPLASLGDPLEMVGVGVGEEDVGDLGTLALGPFEQRLEHPVAVDQDALAAGLVDDQVGV